MGKFEVGYDDNLLTPKVHPGQKFSISMWFTAALEASVIYIIYADFHADAGHNKGKYAPRDLTAVNVPAYMTSTSVATLYIWDSASNIAVWLRACTVVGGALLSITFPC